MVIASVVIIVFFTVVHFQNMNQPGEYCDDASPGEMTPYVKEELKWTILNNRHKRGLGDIDLDEERPTIKSVSSLCYGCTCTVKPRFKTTPKLRPLHY